ncbi:2,3-bisphosphoglycerate-independent phosphoglycerate mutase [Desulfonatronovibrio hydrogenovorans]|uniref:2,3-bisphosphoglycerate-independent phosphoglycerate mutase n=1 Tax=Desulfonatronovibrio hydrogenovorans TaxID=53245 RepID=UPI000491E5C3|nr:2,3-bisphosphoglycerate-independent phosphoglycerate mutase [Desulfonatronovibrio hydrogenovorans]
MPDSAGNPVLLLILDGWGLAPEGPGNAISQAATPNLDLIARNYPSTTLQCSGPHVGLPEGQMGNSEVGHLNIGAGRIVYQDIMRINLAIEQGELENNQNLDTLLSRTGPQGRLHLMGLVSDGGVHSLQNHLHSLITIARQKKVARVFIHCFLDGRDTSPLSGAEFVADLEKHLNRTGLGQVATITGRFYAMDRDRRWDRTRQAYDALTLGIGIKAHDPVQAIKDSYERGETDEFVKPHVMVDHENNPIATLQDGDGVIFFNFRADRARQLTSALYDPGFTGFERLSFPRLNIITMTRYDKNFGLPVLFPPERMKNILAEVISQQGLTQLRIAETEKYAHVTYFFNGGVETPFAGEERVLIPSPREVPTYDLKPEMSVFQVTDVLVKSIRQKKSHLYVCNFANLDMVGHTGNISATIKACQAVDECVGRVMEAMADQNGLILLTADHGNADDMVDGTGRVKTSHSLNPVPLCLVSGFEKLELGPGGILADIAPTILDLWNIQKPREMTGKSLVKGDS